MKENFKRHPLTIFLLFLLIVASVSTYYFFQQYQEAQKLLQNPNQAIKAETQSIVKKVGIIIELPAGEEPTIATVTDINKLKDQLFFAKAANGDKLLIYTKAKKAILYRPSENKVIEVAPLNIGNAQTAEGTRTQAIKVTLYNGTDISGLTNTIEEQLKKKVDNLSVIGKQSAFKKDYEKTFIVDLTGKSKEIAQQLAVLFSGEVVSLPDKEEKPKQGDFLIILGKNAAIK